jgi:hypothetical protein
MNLIKGENELNGENEPPYFFDRIWVKFAVRNHHVTVRNAEFGENRHSGSHTLLSGVNNFYHYFPYFLSGYCQTRHNSSAAHISGDQFSISYANWRRPSPHFACEHK